MFFKKNNGFSYTPTILVAPLDWGLGHATRCIPLIYNLLNSGAIVIIAADGSVKLLLQNEFPELTFLSLPGYNIKYSRHARWLPVTLCLQIPKLLLGIMKEYQWLKKSITQYGIQAVISDNRLGLYNSKVNTVYITHQLCIKTGNKFTERLLQKIHYFFINKYNYCWVPDYEGENNLAGDLSHPKKRPNISVSYTGVLSRFKKESCNKIYDLTIILSGPEPQRTLFENILLPQLKERNEIVLLIRGLPGEASSLKTESNIHSHNHLNAAELGRAIQQSKMVICRSGYSSVMDLVTLAQKAILVPTPGQTEQEYLADYLHRKKIFYCTPQSSFLLQNAIDNASVFPYAFPQSPSVLYEAAVAALLKAPAFNNEDIYTP